MPRLTNRDYLTIRHFLTRLWDQDDGHSFAVLPGYAQRELHDFYAPPAGPSKPYAPVSRIGQTS